MKLSAIIVALMLLTSVGCKTLLGTNASPTSIPVISGAATTNSPQLTAWLQEAQLVNQIANPTGTEPLLNLIITGLITLAGAGAGMYAHSRGVSAGQNQSASAPPPAKTS